MSLPRLVRVSVGDSCDYGLNGQISNDCCVRVILSDEAVEQGDWLDMRMCCDAALRGRRGRMVSDVRILFSCSRRAFRIE